MEIHEALGRRRRRCPGRSFVTWRFTKGRAAAGSRRADRAVAGLGGISATPPVYTGGMVDNDNSIDASAASMHRGQLSDSPVPTPGTQRPGAGWRNCSWCRQRFEVVVRPGRPRLYCSSSCRQRAHEARNGLGAGPARVVVIHAGTSLAPPPTIRTRFQAGRVGFGRGKLHALRWVELVDSSTRRATLCGLLAWSVPFGFSADGDDACRTCVGAMDVNATADPNAEADPTTPRRRTSVGARDDPHRAQVVDDRL